MRFSQRIGKKPVKSILQIESIDEDLLNSLWNTIIDSFFDEIKSYSEKEKLFILIWKKFYKKPVDLIAGNPYSVLDFIRKWFFEVEWYEVYDFIEFIALLDERLYRNRNGFVIESNKVLKKEVAGYRIVNVQIVQITSEEEIIAIEEAINNTDKWKSVGTHLESALNNLTDRKNPNYRNSIKESISAVEAFCKIITGDDNTTLGKALIEIEKTHNLHKALKNSFSALYGYTSDSSGIRHALLESDVNINFEDAKFMLVSCSAFINYLKTKTNI
jgi:hypothetical protein